MQKAIHVPLIMLALGVGFVGCDRADDGRRTDATRPIDRPKADAPRADAPRADVKMSNSDLENVVKAKLSSDEQLRTADLKVDANANKNEVTISGTVQSQEQRSKAIDLAKSAHSGVIVNDKIDVKPAA
jgi:hypothetical protein